MIRVVRYTVVVLTTLTVLLLLWQFSVAILLFLLSLAVSAALRPLINTITSRNVPKRLALGVVYTLLVGAIAGSLFLISPALLGELEMATDDFVSNYDRAKAEWPTRGTTFQQTLAETLPPSTDFYQALTSEEGVPAIAGLVGVAQNFFSTLGQMAIILILSLYWSADQSRFERLGLSLLPEVHHSKALHVWRSVESGVGAYLRSELSQSVVAGLLLWVGFSALGIRYPLLLALWGAIVRLIPWFGALIAGLPALFIGIGISSTLAVLATVYMIGILLALKFLIEPRLFPRNKYSSLLIVLLVIALAETFGFIGVVLAPPLAVAVQILFRHLFPLPELAFTGEGAEDIIDIQNRLLELQRRFRKSRSRQSLRLVIRLQRILRQTTDYMHENS